MSAAELSATIRNRIIDSYKNKVVQLGTLGPSTMKDLASQVVDKKAFTKDLFGKYLFDLFTYTQDNLTKLNTLAITTGVVSVDYVRSLPGKAQDTGSRNYMAEAQLMDDIKTNKITKEQFWDESNKRGIPPKVAADMFPLFKFIVAAVEVFPTAFTKSPIFTTLELSSIIVVPAIWNAIYFTLRCLPYIFIKFYYAIL
jgi:hypothetical protein